jgi:hypothetical protein
LHLTPGFKHIASARLALLLNKSLILIVRPDPNPDEIRAILDSQRSMMRPCPYGPKFANLFEVE